MNKPLFVLALAVVLGVPSCGHAEGIEYFDVGGRSFAAQRDNGNVFAYPTNIPYRIEKLPGTELLQCDKFYEKYEKLKDTFFDLCGFESDNESFCRRMASELHKLRFEPWDDGATDYEQYWLLKEPSLDTVDENAVRMAASRKFGVREGNVVTLKSPKFAGKAQTAILGFSEDSIIPVLRNLVNYEPYPIAQVSYSGYIEVNDRAVNCEIAAGRAYADVLGPTEIVTSGQPDPEIAKPLWAVHEGMKSWKAPEAASPFEKIALSGAKVASLLTQSTQVYPSDSQVLDAFRKTATVSNSGFSLKSYDSFEDFLAVEFPNAPVKKTISIIVRARAQ